MLLLMCDYYSLFLSVKKKLIVTFVHLLLCIASSAQAHLPPSTSFFYQGLALFQKGQYENAQKHFESYIRSHRDTLSAVEAHYYAAMCAVRLRRPDAEERLLQFIKTYPQCHKVAQAYYQLGHLYFSKQDFAKSISYYSQVDKSALNEVMQHEFQYHLAYAHLSEKSFEQALGYFNDIKTHESAYYYAANYYAGYLALRNEDYDTALQDLLKASENAAYQSVVPYLVLQVYYKQKRFEELISYIQKVNKTETVLKNEEEIILLTAEAYFFTDQHVAAAQHYEEYLALTGFVATSEVQYRTAHALYKAGELYRALKYFKELALQQDVIGQAASYYAGLLYLKTHQKILALTAFKHAQQTSFSPEIREGAAFQYAKLSYELGQFVQAIGALQRLKNDYPTSQHLAEVDALLSEAYLHTKDYNLAIAHIEGLAIQPQHVLKVYQKVTFYQGSECFNRTEYDRAIELFRKSLQHPYEKKLTLQAHLWIGESHSAMQQYDQAVADYQYVLDNSAKDRAVHQQALYGLGYARFSNGCYTQALHLFRQYTRLQRTASPWLKDAQVRVADCYYVTKKYQRALQAYDQALPSYPAHVYYQKGVVYRLLQDRDDARKNFQIVFDKYTNTVYYEKALFEVAKMDFVQGNYLKAIQAFTKLVQEKPRSKLVPDALLIRVVAYTNLEQYPQAIRDFEHLLREYPRHPNTKNVLLELPKICTLAGKSEDLDRYRADYQAANSDLTTLEQLTFDSAKGLFYDQHYAAAIKQFNDFVRCYPQSNLVSEAHFWVAEAHYRQGDEAQALDQYQSALRKGEAHFHNKILLRIGYLAYHQKDFTTALQYYQQLKECAQNKKESYYALEGLMKTSYALQHHHAVQQFAALILEQGNMTVNATNEANLFLGKSAMQQGKHDEALIHFTQLVQSATDAMAAEAQFLLAQLHYKTQAYQQSLDALFELNKQFPAYKEWTNRGYLLIADNYLALQEVFQAQATLQSIIDLAEDKELIAIAQQKLTSIQGSLPPQGAEKGNNCD